MASMRVVEAGPAPSPTAGGQTKVQRVRYGSTSVDLLVDWDVGIGGELWSCGLLCCEHLSERRVRAGRVLELGAGTGLAGLFLAKECEEARVVVTDLEDHVALLRKNIELNGLEGRVVAETLDWGEESEIPIAGFDLVLATDCAYHERLHGPLVRVLRRCLVGGGQARCILGVTRSDTSPAFFDRLDGAGLDYRLLTVKDDAFALVEITKRPDFFFSGPENGTTDPTRR